MGCQLPPILLEKPTVNKLDAICLGSGRFLRSVLVPAMNAAGFLPLIVQTRGDSFMRYMFDIWNPELSSCMEYDVDTVEANGDVRTDKVQISGAGSLGKEEGKQALFDVLSSLSGPPSIIGVGVTEAGLNEGSKAMIDLLEILNVLYKTFDWTGDESTISIVNTDNVPQNGNVICDIIFSLIETHIESDIDGFGTFLKDKIVFHNTMVDRITSSREGSHGMVPRCEPVPAKAIVIEDLRKVLPKAFTSELLYSKYGVVVRTKTGQLSSDIALKLRIANGTHTAIAHCCALNRILLTDFLSKENCDKTSKLLMDYLDNMFKDQIEPASKLRLGNDIDAMAVYKDWRSRLCHAHFGLSTFFITQNGAAKGGIRIGPTVRDLVENNQDVSCILAFAIAAILRFLTPVYGSSSKNTYTYKGWLDGATPKVDELDLSENSELYADGMSYNLKYGWYDFKCTCEIKLGSKSILLSEALRDFDGPKQPSEVVEVIESYLISKDGGNLQDLRDNYMDIFSSFVSSIATMYARMVAGDNLFALLSEINSKSGVYSKVGWKTSHKSLVDGCSLSKKSSLQYRMSCIPDDSKLLNISCQSHSEISSVIAAEVSGAKVIDLHTHLLPPSHGSLCLWGIDELLTYHYLVAEYFMTAPASVTPEEFYSLSKSEQADLIWHALFIDRSPISEACRGVITTLNALGLSESVHYRDLNKIRSYYSSFRDKGLEGAEQFCEVVFDLSGCSYAIMTNIPFNAVEAQYWRPKKKQYPRHFKSALRVDPLLIGDRKTIEVSIKAAGYESSLNGLRQYILDWCETIKPEYMMASTPHDFFVGEGTLAGVKNKSVNEDSLKDPFAFVDQVAVDCSACEEGDVPSLINEESPFLGVLMELCEELDLPLAIKIGAHRQVNPVLRDAGDGIVAFADSTILCRLCSRYPRVRFLATFLSRNNQHEACVLATKFRNLHIYGCWWFCNNPSIIKEITTMRLEMLGTAFTAQHSDARIIDQLIYKWGHSRHIIAEVLVDQYNKLIYSGWNLNRAEIRRDVHRLFGTSYEEFMSKSLKT